MKKIKIIGAGLAGSESALRFADAGWKVFLYEMRPKVKTPAHETENFAELVCSNSLKSLLPSTGSGMLKKEMEIMGSKLLEIAKQAQVPAGNALAVDREKFSKIVTEAIRNHTNITVINEEVTEFDDELTILATGPLTSDKMTQNLMRVIGKDSFYFFDAIAPIVSAESLDRTIIFEKSRYDKGEADYLNCPFTKEEYYRFVDALINAEKHEAKEFENQFFKEINLNFYENCTPIEELARRGRDTLRYGVMRPVGLEDPRTDKRAFAIIQLRAENKEKTAYNLVGCQTMMRYPEQKKVLRLIPGMENVEILRYGSIHRNSYLNAPEVLNKNLSLKQKPNIFVAGQLSGVEGYVESIFMGTLIFLIINNELNELPEESMSGQLWRHLNKPQKNFQPMNANFGILPSLPQRIRDKKEKKLQYFKRGVEALNKKWS